MPTFKQLIITGHETPDPVKTKTWRFNDGEFSYQNDFLLVTIPPRHCTILPNQKRVTHVIPLLEIHTISENNKQKDK